jgi:hypothetical protein
LEKKSMISSSSEIPRLGLEADARAEGHQVFGAALAELARVEIEDAVLEAQQLVSSRSRSKSWR